MRVNKSVERWARRLKSPDYDIMSRRQIIEYYMKRRYEELNYKIASGAALGGGLVCAMNSYILESEMSARVGLSLILANLVYLSLDTVYFKKRRFEKDEIFIKDIIKMQEDRRARA